MGLPRVNASEHLRSAAPKTKVPEIAQFMGVRVGYDTIQRLERVLGPGLPMTGGHPHGARLWRVKGTNLQVYADGFNSFHRKGRVIDQIGLEQTTGIHRSEDHEIPAISLSRRLMFLGGRITLGMTRPQVLKAIKGVLPWPFRSGDTWYWERKGHVFVQASETKKKWVAQLTFKKGKVAEIRVEAGE